MAPKASMRRGRPKSVNPPSSSTGIQALNRGLDVLEALASHEGVTLTELSVHLGQSAATMYRVLTTLEQRRYAEASPEGQWFVGPEAFKRGSAFLRRTNIVERSRSVMRDLMSKTGETSNLGIEREGHVLFVSQVESHEMIRAYFPPGAISPLHASGIGKALLSAFDEEGLEGFIKGATFTRFTDKTIASAGRLREELQATRQRGYAVDDEERTIGMRCVAACILNRYSEAVAGISVSGPTARMPDVRLREIGVLVTDAAREISRRLGAD
ncbi:HTH-type transcriptional regulator BhcR [Mesorhizobium sp. BE184]|uniref:HTH-type transcriptional regulator BhcR n=1 Tax=Mesorhizobium sp. BE184 TaxID=2817714 RepID=UPI0038621AC9